MAVFLRIGQAVCEAHQFDRSINLPEFGGLMDLGNEADLIVGLTTDQALMFEASSGLSVTRWVASLK